jgi:hypothetical protein
VPVPSVLHDVHHLDVAGPDHVELLRTASHQPELVPLIRRRTGDATALRRTVTVVPLCDAAATCELRSGGHVVGELPDDLAAEVHSGLLALAHLDPPYLVTLPIRLEWRERHQATQVHATALVDLHDLRLLAC